MHSCLGDLFDIILYRYHSNVKTSRRPTKDLEVSHTKFDVGCILAYTCIYVAMVMYLLKH